VTAHNSNMLLPW